MAVLIPIENEELSIPSWVTDLASFQRWFRSGDYPQEAKLAYFDGNIWAGQQMERTLHTLIKTELAYAIKHWSNQHLAGLTFCDSQRYTSEEAELSCEPDVIFFTEASLLDGTVQMMDGDASLEIEGEPEIIVEVISPTSVKKDQKTLREKYFQAGVQEYWLADSRKVPSLSIMKRGSKGFIVVKPNTQGWIRSEVLGALCRLKSSPGPMATTKVTVEMK
jgi:Uma2 family endonuclease